MYRIRSLLVLHLSLSCLCAGAGEMPNLVYILADDLGYGDVQCQNSDSKIPTPQTRKGIIHHSVYGNFAIRCGKWKYIPSQGGGGWGHSWGMPRVPIDRSCPGQLYNMEDDSFEATNLYNEHPERVKAMDALLNKLVRDGRSTAGAEQQNDVPVEVK